MSKISVDKVYYSEKENVSNEDRENSLAGSSLPSG